MRPRTALRRSTATGSVILIGRGVLPRLGREAAARVRPGPCLLVTDRRVARLHADAAEETLRAAGFAPQRAVLPVGERAKTPAQVEGLLRRLARMKADRGTPVVACGGGVVTDTAGFAAAVYARGVPWIAVPTTVLAMADAAVGGKTGVDLPEGKNLAGAFHHPRLVLADTDVLATLPARHVANGLAEVAKMRVLDGLRPARRPLADLARAAAEPPRLARAVAQAAAAKAAVVDADAEERTGERVRLNLGHTAGHALESLTGYDGSLLHGEAVAIGMVAAARVAAGRGLCGEADVEDLRERLAALGLPVDRPRALSPARIVRAARTDKKRAAGTLRMVLPQSGDRAVVTDVEPGELRGALR